MKITITKILNRTDLAESASHGGLVVTKNAKKFLQDFFEESGMEHDFLDKVDSERFSIHYVDYTSNGTTPNDRVTPIGKYAKKHELRPGDTLVFEKNDNLETTEYFIESVHKLDSAYFVGKSKRTVEVLGYDRFMDIVRNGNITGRITCVSADKYEMKVRYLGIDGSLIISKCSDSFEMYFNGQHIEENNKYFELDTSTEPFELRKTETWKVNYDMDDEDSETNDKADEELVREMESIADATEVEAYSPQPEQKKEGKEVSGKIIPNRDRQIAERALARAGYCCEFDSGHLLFRRRNRQVDYTEPHHLIPLKYDELFENSLDVQANIVSLCSHCHNLIHYGADAEIIIRKLWEDRCHEISSAGIGVMRNGVKVTADILLGFYGIR